MVKLMAKSPMDGLADLTLGNVSLQSDTQTQITSVMPFDGQEAALPKALVKAHGVAWPGPGQMTLADAAQLIWFGRGQAFLCGPHPAPDLARYAALTDQSDAWASVTLSGADAEAVLARLVPMDLRLPHFPTGSAARSLIQHMTGSIQRLSDDRFRLMVFRSMAKTLYHDLSEAMKNVAARAETEDAG